MLFLVRMEFCIMFPESSESEGADIDEKMRKQKK